MKYLFTLLILLLSGQYCNGQNYAVKGVVMDTLNSNALYRGSVVVMRVKDSVIEAYSHTGPDGKFELKLPKDGKYILRITFPSFADFVDVINVKKTTTDLGMLPMVSKEHLLKEFVLTQQYSAIKIKGDTTEYMADSFKVKEGATVEDLLKKLPGIQVDKNGVITAQGETVQKILVDGEEFFSDDPKVVTQGLQSNAVNKVQVFDKKSDQAEFTGIDDGVKTKTINLELKEDKKKGYFGKVDAGGGTDGYFQDQGMINAFRAKSQFSAFAIMSNTDKVGLGWQDNDKFGSGNGVTTISDDGGIMTTYSSSADQDFGGWNGKYNGQGLPETWTGGAHFADRWGDNDKSHITGNYRYAMQNVELDGNTTTQYVLPGNSGFVSEQSKNQFSKGERHGMDFMYEWKVDSSSSVKLTMDGGYKQSDIKSVYNTNTLNNENILLNNNNRTIISTAFSNFVNADLLYKKKFKKTGRTLSIDVKENYKDSKSDGTLQSGTSYYSYDTSSHLLGDSIINQRKVANTNTLALNAKAVYTEPLSKTAFIELDYGVTANNSRSTNSSYNSNGLGGYSTKLNDTFSSDYKYNILSNMGGVNFKFVYKKINFSFGSDVSMATYLQTDHLHGDTSSHYNYLNLFPKAVFTYKLSKQSSIKFTYLGNTQQPSISQIAPLRQNSDPLNITVGNPSLKQQFFNKFTLNFNDYKVLTSQYLFGNFSFNTVSYAVGTRQLTVDGVNTTQYINVNGNYSGYGYLGGGRKIKALDLMAGVQINASINHTNNQIGTDSSIYSVPVYHSNSNDNNTYGIGPYFNYDKTDKYDFSLQPSLNYNQNRSTISTFSSNYWTFSTDFSGTVQLPKKFEIGSSVNVWIRQATPVFTTNNDVVKWNAFIGKKFLKNSPLELKVSVFDILNQNIGYSRTAQAGVVTQSTFNTIRRYGMLQLVWNFTHTPAGAPAPSNGGVMMMK